MSDITQAHIDKKDRIYKSFFEAVPMNKIMKAERVTWEKLEYYWHEWITIQSPQINAGKINPIRLSMIRNIEKELWQVMIELQSNKTTALEIRFDTLKREYSKFCL